MIIGLVHTPYSKYCKDEEQIYNNKKMEQTLDSITEALKSYGHNVYHLPADNGFLSILKSCKPDLLFNYATGINEKNSQAITAGLLEKSNLLYTGSSLKTHFTALYKDLAKLIFSANGVLTPQFKIIRKAGEIINGLSYPLFVKPVNEGSGFGIDQKSVVYNEHELKEKSKQIILKYKQPALIEEFIMGREFTVGILGNEVLPVLELNFPNDNNINTQETKNKRAMIETCPADISPKQRQAINKLALKAYQALNCFDYSRVDMRLSNEGRLYVLEINTLPSLKPGRSSFITMCSARGLNYNEAVNQIVTNAVTRHKFSLYHKPA